MSLLLRFPKIASRDCRDCLLHVYDETTGKRNEFRGEPIKRNPRRGPPCTTEAKCPKGHHSDPIQLSEWNEQAYQHYRTCKAVGDFPDDEIVRRNARIIRTIEDSVQKDEQAGFLEAVLILAKVGRV